MSLTWRFLLGFLVLLAAGLYSMERRLIERVERQYLEAAEEAMVDTAQLLAADLETHVNAEGTLDVSALRAMFEAAKERPFSARIYNLTKSAINTNAYVTDATGRVLFDSDNGRAEGLDYRRQRDVFVTLNGEYGARSSRTDEKDDRSSIMFVGAPIRWQGKIVGMVSVSKPQRSMFAFVDETRLWIRSMSLLIFAAVTVAAILMAGLFAQPIRRLTDYARAITRGERVPVPRFSAPELRTLGHAFEEMRDALQDRNYVESYVQTLTHEMKSPVAAIHGAAELLREELPPAHRDKFIANIQAESRRLQTIIERLLALSAIESRKSLQQAEPVDLHQLAQTLGAQMQPAFETRGLRFELLAPTPGPTVFGETFLLEIALTNLLQNAIEFSPRGGHIRLALESLPGAARMILEDEGGGIPDYALERIFERFYSLQHPATGRKSSGLGLCFVREAAQLHGGTILVANRNDRPGVRATLTLPLETVPRRRSPA